MLKNVKLTINDYGYGQVILDGHDVSKGVRGLNLDSFVGNIPQLELKLVTNEIEVDGQLEVRIDPHSVELLEQLGWTPPSADQGE